MNGGSEPYNPYHFLKECNGNFQIHICNCFKRLRFLAEVSTKLQKNAHQQGNMETRQMGPYVPPTFSANCL